ncbi:hypothetical protein P7C73_g5117, partial [Tremellales sp. Uapishka_1]
MFKNKAPLLPPGTDYTKNLRETTFYKYGHLRSLGLSGEITALAFDPVLSLLAVGTAAGLVHVYGSSAFQFTLPVSAATSSAPGAGIRFLTFHPGHHRLVAIDTANNLYSFSLQQISDSPTPLAHPPLPVREAFYPLHGTVTAIDTPLPSHTHLFLSMKDGMTLAWDLSRRYLAHFKIGNCWGDVEERLVRSGVPGRRKTLGGPVATCLCINPRDINILLIGYEGGVVAWDFQKAAGVKTFEMTLPPGAPGGGSYQDADGSLWTERTPSVTSITWRPDGLVFAVGHSDGCISFWAYAEPDKPLMVRTITHEDVNVTDAESLLSAGALDNQIRTKEYDEDGNLKVAAISANREPIFKLVWAGFPDQPGLQALIAAQGKDPAGEPLSNATVEYAERGETLLLILGGQSEGENPGINILQFPAYQPPKKGPAPPVPSESMSLQERYSFRDSLAPTGTSSYPTITPPEDFLLLPRSSPYFGLAHDPIAIVITLGPNERYPLIPAPQAARGFEAYAFPPPRSTVVPPSPGRKHFLQPGADGERLVAMTPTPASVWAAPPMSPRTPSSSGWRMPWSPGASPKLDAPSPKVVQMTPARKRAKIRRKYRIPASIWSGGLTVLGCELYSLSTPAFKRLISWSIEHGGNEDEPRLPLVGGVAVPDLQSQGAPDVKVVKLEHYRIMATLHSDSTVRFWDASPHILLLPSPLRFEYPSPLPHLTISIGEYLKHPDLIHLPLAKLWENDRQKVKIASVHLAREALECVITMQSGEVIVTKFGEAKGEHDDNATEELDGPVDGYFPNTSSGYPANPMATPGASGNEWIEEVMEIGHIAKWKEDGFKPVAICTVKRGEPVACAVSDIGFIAVAFTSKSLAILDMRGPEVILREGFDEDGVMIKKKKKKNQNMQNVLGEKSLVGTMKWVVSGMGPDSHPRPRLIVSYVSGMTKIYSLVNVLGEWIVETKPPTFTNESLAGPIASFVLDPLTGTQYLPTAESLQAVMRPPGGSPDSKREAAAPHCVWIAASKKSIRCAINFSGDRVAKVELTEEELTDVFYVTRHGQKVLVAITNNGSALFYSVPFLELITRMDLYFGMQNRTVGRISLDDRTGDFIEYSGPLDIQLRTLFHFRKPLPPRIDPCTTKRVIPWQPTPLDASSMVGSWIWGGAPLTGAQLDAIVAGPNRPGPPKPPPAPRKPLITWGEPPEEPVKSAAPTAAAPRRPAVATQKSAARVAGEREDVYAEMTNAAAERWNVLDNLGEHMNNASIGAANMMASARNTALKEAAKGTAKGILHKLF